MLYKVLRTHLDKDQKIRSRGSEVELSDREADRKIEKGIIAPAEGGKRQKAAKAPKKAAHKGAPENKGQGAKQTES